VKLGTSILSLVLAVVSCKDKEPNKPATEPSTAPTTTTPKRPSAIPIAPKPTKPGEVRPRVTIAPMKLDFTGKDLSIDADGTLTAGGKVRGKVTADGKMLGPDGSVMLDIEEDGTVKFAQERDSQKVVVIDPDGGVTIDGEPFMRIDEDGKILSRKKPGPGPLEDDGLALFEGPPATRRMAALVIVATMIGRPAPAPPSTVEKSEVR
jgi:hypothetical protein